MSEETNRFELSEEEFQRTLQDGDAETRIPIIKRLAEGKKTPTCVIVVGMAGSGKTTLMAQLQRSLDAPVSTDLEATPSAESGEEKALKVGYCLNLDPATILVPFGASIDIRDTIDYKQVMIQHKLGPNGAIMTCLNLFATKFDQVMTILEKRSDDLDYILVDTPGQIEAFTWSASGTIMGEALASAFPTVLAFVVDCVRCASSPNTFMSNMLYACSMMYRTRLPLVVVFNKIDVVPHEFLLEWMKDFDVFQEALDEMLDESQGFYGSLTRSLSLVLDEFYRQLHSCGVSAATGDGMADFWRAVDMAAKDFETDYLDDLRNRVDEQNAKKKAVAKDSLRRLQKDLSEEENY